MKHHGRGFTLLQLMVVMVILSVLAALLLTSRPRMRMSRNINNAGAALKQLVTHESVWRVTDMDKNGVSDFWTRDVAGFHCVHDAAGKPVALIDLALAKSDKAPGKAYPELNALRTGTKFGYVFQTMIVDQDGRPYIQVRLSNPSNTSMPLPTAGNAPPGFCTHETRFGFTSYPVKYGADGDRMFMVGEDGVVWPKDSGGGPPVLNRSRGAPPGSDVEWGMWGG